MIGKITSTVEKVWYSIATFVLSKIICIPFIRRPFQKLNNPEYYGVRNAINLRIPINSDYEIGSWFIRPDDTGMCTSQRWESILLEEAELQFGLNKLQTRRRVNRSRIEHNGHTNTNLTDREETVILYLHGNAETRSHNHRVQLYKRFQELGLVVMAIDYRGYADSDGGFNFQNSELTMCQDAISTYHFLKRYLLPSNKVIVWGHSLGTGVTTKLASELKKLSDRPDGYVLEAPFNSMKDEVATFWIAKVFKLLIDVNKLIEKSCLTFNSEKFVKSIKEPIFILHAQDDWVIPYKLGKRVYEAASKENSNAKFYSFEETLRLGHDDIYKANKFDEVVKEIVSNVKESKLKN